MKSSLLKKNFMDLGEIQFDLAEYNADPTEG